jgi:hypothetical protein
MEVSGQIHCPTALPLGRSPCTQWIGGWVGLRTGLDSVEKRTFVILQISRVIFDKRITWRLHIQTVEAKAFRTFIRLYSLFKSERLSASIKFTLHKTLITSVMSYACPVWEFAADTKLMKLQRLPSRVLRNTPVRKLHKAFSITYIYDYITKLSRQQAEVIQNRENVNVRDIGQGEFGSGQAYDLQVTRLPL